MNKNLSRVAVLCITALVSVNLASQTVSSKGTKGSASAQDPNVKSNAMTNSENPNITAPEKKGGPKSRGLGGTCNIHINNQTPLYITFYFNGNPAGAMGPWGDLYPNITQGNAVFYGRATFTDGSVLTFGPQQYTCVGRDFVWTLTP